MLNVALIDIPTELQGPPKELKKRYLKRFWLDHCSKEPMKIIRTLYVLLWQKHNNFYHINFHLIYQNYFEEGYRHSLSLEIWFSKNLSSIHYHSQLYATSERHDLEKESYCCIKKAPPRHAFTFIISLLAINRQTLSVKNW